MLGELLLRSCWGDTGYHCLSHANDSSAAITVVLKPEEAHGRTASSPPHLPAGLARWPSPPRFEQRDALERKCASMLHPFVVAGGMNADETRQCRQMVERTTKRANRILQLMSHNALATLPLSVKYECRFFWEMMDTPPGPFRGQAAPVAKYADFPPLALVKQ